MLMQAGAFPSQVNLLPVILLINYPATLIAPMIARKSRALLFVVLMF
jgi:hypothetical protein